MVVVGTTARGPVEASSPRTRPRLRCGLALLLVGLAAAGCGPEFEPGYRIRDARILAVRADPPEAVPGQSVTFTTLFAGPGGALEAPFGSSWWRCPDDEAEALGDEEVCSRPASRVELGEGLAYEDFIPADFLPLPEPDSDQVPSDRLLGVVLGYWRVLGVTLTQGERIVDAVKRVVVYAPTPLGSLDPRLRDLDVRVDAQGELVPNRNPSLTGVEVREGGPDGPAVSRVKPGGTYWLRPRYDERELQAYWSLKVELSGLELVDPGSLAALEEEELLARFSRVRRCEVPVFSWYVTEGTLRRETTVDERVIAARYAPAGETCEPIEGKPRRPEVRFTAPERAPQGGLIHAWVILRDGRGGTDWHAFTLEVER